MIGTIVIGGIALAGQLLDARTTQVGLANGDTEDNSIMAGLVKKIGIGGFYGFKAGFAIGGTLLCAWASLGLQLTAIAMGAVGGVGFAAGIVNWMSLKKQGIKVF